MCKRKVRSSGGRVEVAVPRDRNGTGLLNKVETTIGAATEKVGLQVEAWHDRPLDAVYNLN
jgi:transposase-like protein